MSQLDFKLMLDISCHLQIPPKQRDFVQAFYQSSLPSHEKYICKPLFGCKLTPPPPYLPSLYGLKRSPRHWYEIVNKALMNIALTPCANASCLYSGILIQGKYPLYLGTYVDDFVYFSQDKEVEKSLNQN